MQYDFGIYVILIIAAVINGNASALARSVAALQSDGRREELTERKCHPEKRLCLIALGLIAG